MPDEDALLDMQLSQEVFQVLSHRLVGQHWAVRAVAVVTGIYSQHLTGQVTVRALGMRQQGWKPVHTLHCGLGRASTCPVSSKLVNLPILILKPELAGESYQITSTRLAAAPRRVYFRLPTSLNK